MHRARLLEQVGLAHRHPVRDAERAREVADALDVQAGLAVARLGGLAEPVDDVELRGAQLGGALADALLEHLVELCDARALPFASA